MAARPNIASYWWVGQPEYHAGWGGSQPEYNAAGCTTNSSSSQTKIQVKITEGSFRKMLGFQTS